MPRRTQVYIDAGGRETTALQFYAGRTAALLAEQGTDPMWRPDKRGGHHERHWGRRLPKALRWLFHRTRPTST